ncbi:MAG: hypothetical protein ACHQU0_02685 [Candidatus Paceibacteria bacterium]
MRHRSVPDRQIYVKEYFDSGRDGSTQFTNVTPEVFEFALRNNYISGKLELGYVSEFEFEATPLGKKEHQGRMQIAEDISKNIAVGKGMRICDLRIHIRTQYVSDEVIKDILNWFVSDGRAEFYEQEGQKFYLRVRKQRSV